MIAYPDGPEIVYRPGSDAKEKSKIAAKERRRDENIEYENLKQLLPVPEAQKLMLDKSKSVRLTMSFIRMRDMFTHREFQYHIA